MNAISFLKMKSRWSPALFGFTALVGGAVLACTAIEASNRPTASQEARQRRIESSANWRAGRFVNALPREMKITAGGMWNFLTGGEFRVPENYPEFQDRSAAEFARAPASGLRVTWLGHSTMLLEIDGGRFLLDPVWGKRVSPVKFAGPARFHRPPLPQNELLKLEIDAVVISHNHYDHLDEPTIRALAKTPTRFIVPLAVGAHLEEWGVAPGRITELDWWEKTRVGGLDVVATPSRHMSGRGIHDEDKTLWASWVFKGPEHRAYFSGDTAMFPGFKEIGEKYGPFDLTMIEVGAYNPEWADVHLGPEQAVEAHRDLRGKVLLPIHWGTFELAPHVWTAPVERTLTAARNSGVRVITPRPGGSIEPTRSTLTARWWPDLPYKRAAEQPVVSSGLEDRRVDHEDHQDRKRDAASDTREGEPTAAAGVPGKVDS